MPLTGDFAKFAKHAKVMAYLGQGGLISKRSGMLEEARANLQQATLECFFLQRAPDGTPWAERKTRYYSFRDSNPILFNMSESIKFEIEYADSGARFSSRGSHIVVYIPDGDPRGDFWMYHQQGTKYLPARPFLPRGDIIQPGQHEKAMRSAVRAIKRLIADLA